MTLQILIWTKDFVNIKVIKDVNDKGFTLNDYHKEKRILWEEIQDIELQDDQTILVRLIQGSKKWDKEFIKTISKLLKTE